MGRMVEIEVEGAKALAVIHDHAAPTICEAIWRLLPLELPFHHTNFCGRQVNAALRGDKFIKLPPEAPQLFIQPGDLIYVYREPYLSRSGKDELSEIAFYYGRDVRRWTNRGYGIVRDRYYGSTIWATVIEGLAEVGRQLEGCRFGYEKPVLFRPRG